MDFSEGATRVSWRSPTELEGVEEIMEGEHERGYDDLFGFRRGCRDNGSSLMTRGFGRRYSAISIVSIIEILAEHVVVGVVLFGRVSVADIA